MCGVRLSTVVVVTVTLHRLQLSYVVLLGYVHICDGDVKYKC